MIAFLAGNAITHHGPMRDGYHMMSWNQMRQIGLGLELFRRDHNQLPHQLSELVPEYIGGSRVFFFRSPYTTSVLPSDADSHSELIDKFSAYSFAVLPDERILVFERPGVWSDGTMTYLLLDGQSQPVGTYRSCRVTPEEFQRRLSRQFPIQH